MWFNQGYRKYYNTIIVAYSWAYKFNLSLKYAWLGHIVQSIPLTIISGNLNPWVLFKMQYKTENKCE